LAIFCSVFALFILLAVDYYGHDQFQAYTMVAFIVGCVTSVASGYIGMKIATFANSRTAYSAVNSLADGF